MTASLRDDGVETGTSCGLELGPAPNGRRTGMTRRTVWAGPGLRFLAVVFNDDGPVSPLYVGGSSDKGETSWADSSDVRVAASCHDDRDRGSAAVPSLFVGPDDPSVHQARRPAGRARSRTRVRTPTPSAPSTKRGASSRRPGPRRRRQAGSSRRRSTPRHRRGRASRATRGSGPPAMIAAPKQANVMPKKTNIPALQIPKSIALAVVASPRTCADPASGPAAQETAIAFIAKPSIARLVTTTAPPTSADASPVFGAAASRGAPR